MDQPFEGLRGLSGDGRASKDDTKDGGTQAIGKLVFIKFLTYSKILALQQTEKSAMASCRQSATACTLRFQLLLNRYF